MSHVLGIDISSHAIDLVRLDENTNAATWQRLELEGKTSFERLRQVGDAMHGIEYENIYLAAIERPKTRFMPSAAALFPIFGAVVANLPSVEVWDVSPTDWRRGLGLKGNAKKDECAEAVDRIAGGIYLHTGESWPQDAFDAYAVAYYARELNARGVALDEAREKQLVIV